MKALYHQIPPRKQEFIIYLFQCCGINLKEIGEILRIDKKILDSFYQRCIKSKIKRLVYPGTDLYASVKRRRKRLKLMGVIYLGGKCSSCGHCKDIHSLEFHHQRDKEFTISKHTNASWSKWKSELDKCCLLCSNCHRSEHSSDSEKFNQALTYFNQL